MCVWILIVWFIYLVLMISCRLCTINKKNMINLKVSKIQEFPAFETGAYGQVHVFDSGAVFPPTCLIECRNSPNTCRPCFHFQTLLCFLEKKIRPILGVGEEVIQIIYHWSRRRHMWMSPLLAPRWNDNPMTFLASLSKSTHLHSLHNKKKIHLHSLASIHSHFKS